MATKQDKQIDSFVDSMDAGDLAEGWRPQEGSMVVGKVAEITRGWSDQSESYYPIVVVDDEATKKPVAIHCFHAALKRKMLELKPKVGERIGIKMGPKIPLKRNPSQSVQTYTVRIDGRTRTGEEVWSSVEESSPKPTSDEAQEAQEEDDDLPF
jgi:hypothetical protein